MKTGPEEKGRAGSGLRISRILVPLDFSSRSENALAFAKALSARFRSQLILLNVAEPVSPTGDLALDLARIRTNLELNAKSRLATYRRNAGKGTRAFVRVGSPAHIITEEARRLEVDLIILATHGRTGLAHLALGSVAERVVRHAPCPVLVVREKVGDFIVPAPRKIETGRVSRPGKNKSNILEEL